MKIIEIYPITANLVKRCVFGSALLRILNEEVVVSFDEMPYDDFLELTNSYDEEQIFGQIYKHWKMNS